MTQPYESSGEWAADVLAIQNLQGRYQQLLTLMDESKLIKLFSTTTTPRFEVGSNGVHVGLDSIAAFFQKYCDRKEAIGIYFEHQAICPVIEINPDRVSATGTWFSPGLSLDGRSKMQVISWGRYVSEYVKEDGLWKFSLLHWVEMFNTEWEKGPMYDQMAHFRSSLAAVGELTDDYYPVGEEPSTFNKVFDPNTINRYPFYPPEPSPR